jgi:hypothetical protein
MAEFSCSVRVVHLERDYGGATATLEPISVEGNLALLVPIDLQVSGKAIGMVKPGRILRLSLSDEVDAP